MVDQVLERIYMMEEYVLSAMTIQETVSLFLAVIVQLAKYVPKGKLCFFPQSFDLCCSDSPEMVSCMCWIPKLFELGVRVSDTGEDLRLGDKGPFVDMGAEFRVKFFFYFLDDKGNP